MPNSETKSGQALHSFRAGGRGMVQHAEGWEGCTLIELKGARSCTVVLDATHELLEYPLYVVHEFDRALCAPLLPSPTDAAVTEARDRVVEAITAAVKQMRERYKNTPSPDLGWGSLGREVLAATDALLALTAPPKPPLEVALEALIAMADSLQESVDTDDWYPHFKWAAKTWLPSARAVLATIKGEEG